MLSIQSNPLTFDPTSSHVMCHISVLLRYSLEGHFTEKMQVPKSHLYFISTIISDCIFVLVPVPERVRFPAEVRTPTAVAKTRISIPETIPLFAERILEERCPLTNTHVDDDWFVLLDVDLKESGIFFLHVLVYWFATTHTWSRFFHPTNRLLTFAPCLQDTHVSCRWQCTLTVIQGPLTMLCFAYFSVLASHQFMSFLAHCSLTSSPFASIFGWLQELNCAFALIPLCEYSLLAHFRF